MTTYELILHLKYNFKLVFGKGKRVRESEAKYHFYLDSTCTQVKLTYK